MNTFPPGKRNRKEHNLHYACPSPTNNLHTVPYIVLFSLLTMCLFPSPNIQYLTLGLCSVLCVPLLFFTFSFFQPGVQVFQLWISQTHAKPPALFILSLQHSACLFSGRELYSVQHNRRYLSPNFYIMPVGRSTELHFLR